MTTDWVKFTDLLSTIVDNRGKTCPVQSTGLPLIATNCINGIDLYPNYETKRFVSEDTYKTWFRGHPKAGDILFVCKGSPGRTNWVPDPVDFCIAQDMVAVRADPEKVYPKYLFAVLRSSIIQSQIQNMHVGTMIPHFKKGDFDKLKIPLLDKKKQVDVGDLYFDISERISILKKNNETLEQIVNAIFKSWFIDFDPLRAKCDGVLLKGIDANTALLFPNRFVDSELGQIPEGWTVSKVCQVASIVKGKSYSSKDLVDKCNTALVTLKSFERGGGFKMDGFKPYSGAYKQEQIVSSGDLIVAYTDVTQAAELIGKPALVNSVDEYQTLVASLDVGIVRPKENLTSKQFLYGLFKTDAFQAHTLAHTSGTTVLHLSKDAIGSYSFANPPLELSLAFEKLAVEIAERIQVNIDKGRTLLNLRDALLPRFIAGRLKANETEMESITV